jgi:hypothetical protein
MPMLLWILRSTFVAVMIGTALNMMGYFGNESS